MQARAHDCRHVQASCCLLDTVRPWDSHCARLELRGAGGALTCGRTSPNECGHGGRDRSEEVWRMPVRSAGEWSRSAGHGCGCTHGVGFAARQWRKDRTQRNRSGQLGSEALHISGSAGAGSARARHTPPSLARVMSPRAPATLAACCPRCNMRRGQRPCLRERTEEAARDDETAERLMRATMRAAMGAIRPVVRACVCPPHRRPPLIPGLQWNLSPTKGDRSNIQIKSFVPTLKLSPPVQNQHFDFVSQKFVRELLPTPKALYFCWT